MSYWTRIQKSLNKEFVDDDEILENSNVQETKTEKANETTKEKNNLNLKYNTIWILVINVNNVPVILIQ